MLIVLEPVVGDGAIGNVTKKILLSAAAPEGLLVDFRKAFRLFWSGWIMPSFVRDKGDTS